MFSFCAPQKKKKKVVQVWKDVRVNKLSLSSGTTMLLIKNNDKIVKSNKECKITKKWT